MTEGVLTNSSQWSTLCLPTGPAQSAKAKAKGVGTVSARRGRVTYLRWLLHGIEGTNRRVQGRQAVRHQIVLAARRPSSARHRAVRGVQADDGWRVIIEQFWRGRDSAVSANVLRRRRRRWMVDEDEGTGVVD
jgi:hypothetical protein